ncbi:antigen WC1.1-like [Electrophorus electricus]|uniref:antigen WC1.1-like n=1 Tax=Electrophorus electricus TaxID=8005 RepID=UPI0015D04E21|nr:antigen WC1.1-like [Electrophorus electricus]
MLESSAVAFHEGRVRLSGGRECEGQVEVYFIQDWRRVLLDSSHSSIRLVGSGGDCAGRLEVFHNGSWGTVCDDSWDIEDAQVVCRQLQCGVALSAHVPAWFAHGTGPIWLNEVQCEGNETSIWNCRYQLCGEHECGHKEDVGVVCSEFKEIRLTEGCEGNLEVFYNGTWGNVCENRIDEETATLICQELNCGTSGSENSNKPRVESSPDWLDDLKCRKHDSTLWHCPSSSWGKETCSSRVARITCTEKENIQVQRSHLKCSSSSYQRQCSNHMPLRLRGAERSCSGRLEVYHNAVWGSICDDQWDIRDAEVVCRQLGCGKALRADGSAAFGAGEGVIWLNRVKCRGDEIHLWDCSYSLKKHTDCSHIEDAGVTCADPYVSPTTAPRTTTSTSTITDAQKTTSPLQTTSAAVPCTTPTVVLMVLGVLLFLVLVLLSGLVYQNRVLRRVISKRRRKTLPEAVYEEIDRRYINKRTRVSTRRGSVLSESQHSGYEDVDQAFVSGKSVTVDQPEYYDDVTTTGDLISDIEREDIPENYDDVITAGPSPDIVAEDVSENYDDVITDDQNAAVVTEEMTENYDDVITTGLNPNITAMATPEDCNDAGTNPNVTEMDTPENSDDIITAGQDVGGVNDYEDMKEEPQKEINHMTKRPHQAPFLRKLHLNFFKLKK